MRMLPDCVFQKKWNKIGGRKRSECYIRKYSTAAATEATKETEKSADDRIVYKSFAVSVDGLDKSLVENDRGKMPVIHLKPGVILEDGYNLEFCYLNENLVSYKNVKKAENWADWYMDLSDGKLVEYIDGKVGVSIYLCDERIPMGTTENQTENAQTRQYYRVIYGNDESEVVAEILFPYGFTKSDVDEVLSTIHMDLA